MPRTLAPLAQHRALKDWLFSKEREVCDWFAKTEQGAQDEEQVRLSLLRDNYRMEPADHPEVFREIEAGRAALGMDTAVHAYQAEHHTAPNAAVCHLQGEAHIVFSGPVLSLLSAEELRAVIGHELAHHHLWRMEGGEFLLAEGILHASANHPGAEPAHARSARMWRLATELFADRGAFLAGGSLEAAVGALVKITTGLAQVNAKSYLAQAAEIFSKSKPNTARISHPETFLRARALQLWVEESEALEETIERMLDSGDGLDGFTLPRQAEMTALTRRFLSHLLEPAWFRTDPVLAHARQFFPDFAAAEDLRIIPELATLPTAEREFFAWVMLDFCAVDPDLQDHAIPRCLAVARDLECLGMFEKLITRELRLKAKDLRKLKEAAP